MGLDYFFTLLEGNGPPAISDKDRIARTWASFTALCSSRDVPPVYGANTFPGHKDGTTVDETDVRDFNFELIDSHCIGSAPWLDPEEVKAITSAKFIQLSQPGSIVSPEMLDSLLAFLSESNFNACVPRFASYSSGDVIPAAHWARHFTHKMSYEMKQGEAMSLLNGTFVQTGLGGIALKQLYFINQKLKESLSSLFTGLTLSDDTFLVDRIRSKKTKKFIHSISEGLIQDHRKGRQLPVSMRAIPFLVDELHASEQELETIVDSHLSHASGNPLFCEKSNRVISQGSFLGIDLTSTMTSIKETLLAVMWDLVSICKFILSGELSNIPVDASTDTRPLGCIQVPKLMQAKVEKARQYFGGLFFSTGGETSYGIEDFWSHGSVAVNHVLELEAEVVEQIAALDSVMEYCFIHFGLFPAARKNQPREDDTQWTGIFDRRLEALQKSKGDFVVTKSR